MENSPLDGAIPYGPDAGMPAHPLVVVGSSAGGIEALSALCGSLPEPFAAPMVIAQHLDPTRESHLGEILARRTRLKVKTVQGLEHLERGVIYVVPSDRHVAITDDSVSLLEEKDGRPRPSVDLLLSTAASIFGEHLIALILTGSGSDGTVGARRVQEVGGVVVVQDPETARFPDMPRSVASTSADIVAPLQRLGEILSDLVSGQPLAAQPPPDGYEQLLKELHERAGIDFSNYKEPTIRRRLARRLLATESPDLAAYKAHLEKEPDEYERLAKAFLVNVTEFFRDPEVYDVLQTKVLPELIKVAQENPGGELRIWSAGCSTGEEAYSLAMSALDALGDNESSIAIRIFATDISADAIAVARRGIYPVTALSRISPSTIERHFTAVEDGCQVKKRVRAIIVFGEHNLAERSPFPRIDLIVCRNVLIYFNPELQRHTLELFAFSLRDGGYLMLGKAESVSPAGQHFNPVEPKGKLYQRKGLRLAVPPLRPRNGRPSRRGQAAKPARWEPAAEEPRPRQVAELMSHLPNGVVLIDRHYDVLEINAAARRLLAVHSPAIGEDFVHLARQVSHRALRTALDAALRGETPGALEDVEIETVVDGSHHIAVSCFPLGAEQKGKFDRVLVVITERTELVRERSRVRQLQTEIERAREDAATAAAAAEQLRVGNLALEESLSEATRARSSADSTAVRLLELNRELVDANERLTAANTDLRVANEDFLVIHEESQASAEEIETLNEEFQSTNEELETVNEELQATVEELHTTNADLGARSDEMRELAAKSEAERNRLEATLLSMEDGVVMIHTDGTSALTNEAYRASFGSGDFTAYDSRGAPIPRDQSPWSRARRGETFRMEFGEDPARPHPRQFEASGRPLKSESETASGGVVVIRDITERSRAKRNQDRFLAMASHELRTPLVPLRGYLEMVSTLLRSETQGGKAAEFAEKATRQIRRLNRLVEDLVDASRFQFGKFQLSLAPLDLAELVDQVARDGRVTHPTPPIRLAISSRPLEVLGDRARLEQVLVNLLGNAAKHAADSIAIEVDVRRIDGQVEISVSDQGLGIQESEAEKVFDRFYQSGESGSDTSSGLGLGLFISKEIIVAHQGSIRIEQTTGGGATFIVSLPLIQAVSP